MKERTGIDQAVVMGGGEGNHDLNAGNPDASAKATGCGRETEARYSRKSSYEEAQESYAKHYPPSVEVW